MQNNIDYREIAQAVSQIVMMDISNKLDSMKRILSRGLLMPLLAQLILDWQIWRIVLITCNPV